MQKIQIERLSRPPHCHGLLLAYSDHLQALYIGDFGQPLSECRYVPRPRALNSSEWWITELLGKYAPPVKPLVEEPTED
jgi:hypothetical protein